MTNNSYELRVFAFSRVFATIGVFCALLFAVAVLVAVFVQGAKNTHVSYADVSKAIGTSPEDASGSSPQQGNALKIPASVEKYFESDSKNREILMGWLGDLDESGKEDFLSNLEGIITKAEKESKDVYPVVNKYKELKFSKLNKSEFERYADKAAQAGYIAMAIAAAGFAVLLSLVLVLLAIERNTRAKALDLQPVV